MDALLDRLRDALGADALVTGDELRSRPVSGQVPVGCDALALVRPRSTAEVALALRLCHEAGRPVVPRGGMTGLVAGTVTGPGEIALSLERLDRIEGIDTASSTLTVQAGVIIETAQRVAAEHGLLFALDLGARGSATIGGAIATNAGGNKVIRYGMMREMVLGLEAVLADGTVVPAMNRMLKNNTGLDLKHLFIGTEGTLGVVTRAVLRLHPLPRARHTALATLPDFAAVTDFLGAMRAESNGILSSFEVMWDAYYRLAVQPAGRLRPPLPPGAPFTVLVEWEGDAPDRDAERFADALGHALEAGRIADAVIAQSEAERTALWAVRDEVTEHLRPLAPCFTYDVSLPIPAMPDYVDGVVRAVAKRWPGGTAAAFGHLGDGNLHLALAVGSAEAKPALNELVYRPLAAVGGAVSAEHGVGLERRSYLELSRSPAERAVMTLVKRALDPAGALNPGKVLEL